MSEFVNALVDPDIPFLRYALLAGLMASIAFGMVGSFVVARRISYIAGAISHSILGGIGGALFLRSRGHDWCSPMLGAIIFALAAALIIGLVSIKAKQREDTVIGAIWAIGMALGLLFIAKTPGYIDPMSYLFGNILIVSAADLWVIGIIDVLVVTLCLLFYNKLVAVCFDGKFARLRGVRVDLIYLGLLCLTALTIVMLVSIVGIVMVIAFLTLPAAIAGNFTKRLWSMMCLAVALSMIFSAAGLAVSYSWEMPSGPCIISLAGAGYLLSCAFGAWRRRETRHER